MNIMRNVYDTLKTLPYFIDNEYLLQYASLIERHTQDKVVPRKTHKHHIVPKSWFKLNGVEIDNSLKNLVNLPCREHCLAHYYLCLCTVDPFRYANELALACLLNKKFISPVDKELLIHLPMYNTIYEDYNNKLKSNYKLWEGVTINDNKSSC